MMLAAILVTMKYYYIANEEVLLGSLPEYIGRCMKAS